VLAIGFEIRERRERKSDDGATPTSGHADGPDHDSEPIDERTGLLAVER